MTRVPMCIFLVAMVYLANGNRDLVETAFQEETAAFENMGKNVEIKKHEDSEKTGEISNAETAGPQRKPWKKIDKDHRLVCLGRVCEGRDFRQLRLHGKCSHITICNGV